MSDLVSCSCVPSLLFNNSRKVIPGEKQATKSAMDTYLVNIRNAVAVNTISVVARYDEPVLIRNASMVLKTPNASTAADAIMMLSYGQISMIIGRHLTANDMLVVTSNTVEKYPRWKRLCKLLLVVCGQRMSFQ